MLWYQDCTINHQNHEEKTNETDVARQRKRVGVVLAQWLARLPIGLVAMLSSLRRRDLLNIHLGTRIDSAKMDTMKCSWQ